MLSTQDYLSLVSNRSQRDLPMKRVYRNIRNEDLFMTGYHNLYTNDGALTAGVDPEDTVNGMSKQRIRDILEKLDAGTYQWTPARSAYIPKKNGSRRLSVPGWKDKLLQEVIRQVLEAYYEPQFRESSHGFRPQRGCHTALKAIQQNWTGTKWFIEGDIKSCFDSIDHDILLDTIAEDFHDQRFIKLISGMLKAGYLDEDWKFNRTYSGTPQGGVVSPILANIVLNKLDVFVEDVLIPKYTRGKVRAVNPAYRRVYKKRKRAWQREEKDSYRQLTHAMRQLPSKATNDENYSRLRYVRYADDFLLGFIGNKADAQAIKEEIATFLSEIGLTLSEEKTLVTHARTERATFLGYEIGTGWDDSKLIRNKTGARRKQRRINGNIKLYVPQSVVLEWTRNYTRKGKPYPVGRLAQHTDFEIIKDFGIRLRGLINYYGMASNIAYAIGNIRWVMLQALVKTLKRGRKNSVKSVYRKYQRRSEKTGILCMQAIIPRDDKPPLVATFGEESLSQKKDVYLRDEKPARVLTSKNSELVRRLKADCCEVCGKTGETEAHHVRRIANLKKRYGGRKQPPTWVMWMIRRNRKTIFVCRNCHDEITFGRYDQRKLI